MSARDGGSTKRGQGGRMANLPSLARYFLKPECRSSRVLCARSGALLPYLTLPLFEFTSIFHVPLPALLLPRPIVMLPSLIRSNDDRSVGQPIWSPIARASFQNCHFKSVILSETGSAKRASDGVEEPQGCRRRQQPQREFSQQPRENARRGRWNSLDTRGPSTACPLRRGRS
jgi:hypothetical protein